MHTCLALLALLLLASGGCALDNGLARTPPRGFNSWTAYGTGVDAGKLKAVADFFVSSGLREAGYLYVNSDDGFSLQTRDPVNGRIVADPAKFPDGMANVTAYIRALGLQAGIYTASSSVVCSGRPGSLFHEALDAQTFVEWGFTYVKIDLCAEYAYGNQARYTAFADALNATGVPVLLSTEPYDLIPDPAAATFSNVWRCCNDIDASWDTIMDRIDRNDVLAPLVGPGAWSDADMLQVGNGALTPAEQNAHFALWAITKNPLLLATDVTRLSPAQLALVKNPGLLAANADSLGVPARKLAIDGAAPLRHVGLAPCEAAANTAPRANLLSGAALQWQARALPPVGGAPAFALFNAAAQRCLALAPYAGAALRPVLQPCSQADASQAWALPGGAGHLGALVSLAPSAAGLALAPAPATLYAALHGSDATPVADAAYGLTSLVLAPYAPPGPCASRSCANYTPSQTWYWSARSGLLALAVFSANHYRCFEGPCEVTTGVVPAPAALCLAHVLSVAYAGTDPSGSSAADVWGGPLAGGDFVLALHNRAPARANVSAALGALGVPPGPLCALNLLTGERAGPLAGSVSAVLDAHDIAPLRLSAPPCAA